MSKSERVTVTLPAEVVRAIDSLEKNRSKFVLQAVQREVEARRREALRRSLANPHPESQTFADLGFEDWARSLPDDDAANLLDPASGTPVRWLAGEGWKALPDGA